MAILICAVGYDGCGFIGHSDEFRKSGESPMDRHIDDADLTICPQCNEDHIFGLTAENFLGLTDETNRELAEKLLRNDESCFGRAHCGCWYSAEEGILCIHDIQLAREKLWRRNAA